MRSIEKSKNIIKDPKKLSLYFIVICIILGFILQTWNSNGFEDEVVANVGPMKITKKDFNLSYSNKVNYISNSLGYPMNAEQEKMLGIRDMVLNELIESKLIDNMVKDAKLKIGDESIALFIRSRPEFKNEKGEFDKNKLRKLLNNARISETDFKKEVAEDIVRFILIRGLLSNYELPEGIYDSLFDNEYQTRVIDSVELELSAKEIKKLDDPTEKELQLIYKNYKNDFIVPEYRRGYFIRISDETLRNSINITSEEIEAIINREPILHKSLIKRDIIDFEFRNMETAQDFILKFNKTNNLEITITHVNDDLISHDKIKNKSYKDFEDTQLRNAIFSTDFKSLSKPFLYNDKWHIVYIDREYKTDERSVNNINKTAKEIIMKDRINHKLTSLMVDIDKGLHFDDIKNNYLEELSEKLKVKIDLSCKMDINGTCMGNEINNYYGNKNIRKLLFNVEAKNKVSDFKFIPETQEYMFVYCNDIINSRAESFDEAKYEIIEIWKSKQYYKILSDESAEIKKIFLSIGNSEKFLQYCEGKYGKEKVKINSNVEVYRQNVAQSMGITQNNSMHMSYLDDIFALNKKGDSTEIISVGNQGVDKYNFAFATLKDIRGGNMNTSIKATHFKKYRDHIDNIRQEFLYTSLTEALKKYFPIKINKAFLDS